MKQNPISIILSLLIEFQPSIRIDFVIKSEFINTFFSGSSWFYSIPL